MWQKDWDEAEKEWDQSAQAAANQRPVKGLPVLPQMPGITKETAKHLKWKALKWMVTCDHEKKILKGFLKHPFKYGWALIKSLLKNKSYQREGDFFLYNTKSLESFKQLLENPNAIFILGFSYCHKPFECPSGRFTPDCIQDPENVICRQCFIGKATEAASQSSCTLIWIPTIHYVGAKIFEIVHQNPGKPIVFMITACEMTLEMFGDWGNMVQIKGIGIRLDGRICNTMRAFELSERGIKPGLTVVLDATQKKMLEFIRHRLQAGTK